MRKQKEGETMAYYEYHGPNLAEGALHKPYDFHCPEMMSKGFNTHKTNCLIRQKNRALRGTCYGGCDHLKGTKHLKVLPLIEEGKTTAEIAAVIGVSKAAVAQRKYREEKNLTS